MNFTLTITATPELLKILNKITEAFTNAEVKIQSEKVVTPSGTQTAPLSTVVAPVQISQQSRPVHPAVPVQQTQVQTPTIPIQQPVAAPVPVQQPVQVAPASIPTTQQTYTMDQLALGATQLMDAGHLGELQQLLAGFGVQALTMLPKEQYGIFATKLREMGAKL